MKNILNTISIIIVMLVTVASYAQPHAIPSNISTTPDYNFPANSWIGSTINDVNIGSVVNPGNQINLAAMGYVFLPKIAGASSGDLWVGNSLNVVNISKFNNDLVVSGTFYPNNIYGEGEVRGTFLNTKFAPDGSGGNANIIGQLDVAKTLNIKDHFNVTSSSSNFIKGKLSIGTNAETLIKSLDYGLYVEKGIISNKIKLAIVNSAAWADYVFSKNYKLRPLNEVKQYIIANNHLPEIPTATEVIKNGIEVGDITAKLLAKIEELTLYTIELHEKIEQLQSENKDIYMNLNKFKK